MKREDFFDINGRIEESKLPQINGKELMLALLGVPFSYFLIIFVLLIVGAVSSWILYLLTIWSLEHHIAAIITVVCIPLAIGLLISLYSAFVHSIKSFFAKPFYETGISFDMQSGSTLTQDIQEVCSKMNCPIPDNVVISFKPEFYVTALNVYSGGNLLKGRTLVLGMSYLKYLTRREIKSVLSHEMAHFTGKDTLFSKYVAPVFRNIPEILDDFDNIYQDSDRNPISFLPMIPVSMVLSRYLIRFMKLESKISREREKRADYIAAVLYGNETFKNALTKVTNISTVFCYNYENDFTEVYKRGKMFNNYFDFFDSCVKDCKIDFTDRTDLDKDTDIFDSHCSTVERFNYLPDIPADNTDCGYEVYPASWEEEITEDMAQYFYAATAAMNMEKQSGSPAEDEKNTNVAAADTDKTLSSEKTVNKKGR